MNNTIKYKGYEFWSDPKIVKPHIIKYLKELFKDSLIICEFNRIDITVLDENLPIEIQGTFIKKKKDHKDYNLSHAEFEDSIRRQIEDNIENYNVCWLFFDSEYYRYLNETNNIQRSFNLDWFSNLVKENKLKVFTIKYDGTIKELYYRDLNFILKSSYTCKLEYNSDKRILNRNKLKIINNVLKGYDFSQNEIDNIINEFNNRSKYDQKYLFRFLTKHKDLRKRTYGLILWSLGCLDGINNLLDMDPKFFSEAKFACCILGIFENEGSGRWCRTRFYDKFDICQYFPGYERNKNYWSRLDKKYFNKNQLIELFLNIKKEKL